VAVSFEIFDAGELQIDMVVACLSGWYPQPL